MAAGLASVYVRGCVQPGQMALCERELCRWALKEPEGQTGVS
jgi:hypothetical protein